MLLLATSYVNGKTYFEIPQWQAVQITRYEGYAGRLRRKARHYLTSIITLRFSVIADAILWLVQDCEFTYLSTQILHLLGQEGPATQEPAKYIRYIYNRVILENATVRAAAVTCLAKFAAYVEELKPRIIVLLKRALYDNDDEVMPFSLISLLWQVSSTCVPV